MRISDLKARIESLLQVSSFPLSICSSLIDSWSSEMIYEDDMDNGLDSAVSEKERRSRESWFGLEYLPG